LLEELVGLRRASGQPTRELVARAAAARELYLVLRDLAEREGEVQS
jgi:hypothetical protein